MKISIARSAGFCFGVKRAIQMALDAADCAEDVIMLGDLVHNENVVKQIQEAGIKKVRGLASALGRTLLLRAHGTSQKTIKAAEKMGYRIIDATCPMVKEIHKIARQIENKGLRVIIIGDRKHEEVLGIAGNLKKEALIIDGSERLPLSKIKKIKKAGVVVQSTQNLEKVLNVIAILKKYIPRLEFHNTICRPTTIKQAEIRKMPSQNGIMIVIGSKKSANTKRLFEISKAQNLRTYWLNSKKEFKKEWLKGVKSVGITAGASTPESTIRDIVRTIQKGVI
jgi:4-hydroxy-3-methylbut-2-enyl diphosphate reductase